MDDQTRLLTVLGALSASLGAALLVWIALRGEPLVALDSPAGGAWGALGAGLAVLGIARSRSDA